MQEGEASPDSGQLTCRRPSSIDKAQHTLQPLKTLSPATLGDINPIVKQRVAGGNTQDAQTNASSDFRQAVSLSRAESSAEQLIVQAGRSFECPRSIHQSASSQVGLTCLLLLLCSPLWLPGTDYRY